MICLDNFICFSISVGIQCSNDPKHVKYIGHMNQTKTGLPCQRWDKQTPQSHTFTDPKYFQDVNVTLADIHNYCRNPGGTAKASWCYVDRSSATWDYCDIPICFGRYLF